MRSVRARVRRCGGAAVHSPLTWVLAAIAALHVVGIGWGLPASDGWDHDGVAPRDFLAGLLETFAPGHSFTYPPVHLVVLGVLTAPITLVALVRAASFAPADVIAEILKVPYMTAISYVARLATVAMSIGLVWSVAKIGEELRGRRVGLCVAAVCGVNATLTYYAKTSNLDVPCLFWACLALLALTRAIARHEPRRLRTAAIMAALAVGTKDQACAIFVLAAPLALTIWVLADRWARDHVRAVGKEIRVSVALGTVLLLVLDGALFNPSGFRARVAFLLGPGSKDVAHYANDALGRARVTRDAFLFFDHYYPPVFGVLIALGFLMHVLQRGDRAKKVAGLVPLLAAVSFTVLFNWVALRTEHRFLLPQMVLVSVYGGIALEPLVFGFRGWRRTVAHGIASVGFALAIFGCVAVDANLVLDPRYEAETWLAHHVAPGESVEVYGLNAYMPRFPRHARVVRVGREPVRERSPLSGMEEVEDSFGRVGARAPRFIVVSQGWAWRYLLNPRARPAPGAIDGDPDGADYFRALLAGEKGYRLAHASTWDSRVWPRYDIHGSVAREIWIYERE